MSVAKSDKGRERGIPYPKQAENGFWYVHYSVGRRSKRESLGTKEEKQALARFAQWILLDGAQRSPDAPGSSSLKVEELWEVYWKKHVLTDAVAPQGKETIRYAWQNLKPHFGHLLPDAIDQQTADDYEERRTRIRADPKRPALPPIGRKVAAGTVRREIAYLMAALKFCTKGKRPLLDPHALPILTLPEGFDPRDRWLRMDEIQRLLDAAAIMRRKGRDGAPPRLTRAERFLWLALETAARKQAILDLTWDRVDFETNTIHFDVPGRRKTKKRRAAVSISAALRPILLRAYEERISDLVMDNKAAVWKSIQVAAIKAGFSDQPIVRGQKPKATGISPHVLRHTAATHMARNGVPLWKIAQVLGNTLAMVEKVYAKWTPDDPAGTVDMISGGALEAAE